MTDNIEKIVQEAECVAAADEYFKARAWLMDTNENRRIFEAGFDRAYALLSKLRAEGVQAGEPVADERCKRCGGPGWYTSHTTGYPESIPCSACNPQGVSVDRLENDPFLAAQLWRKTVDADGSLLDRILEHVGEYGESMASSALLSVRSIARRNVEARIAEELAALASAPVADERMAQGYGSPADVAQRIEQYLYHDGRKNSATQLLYEAMKALRTSQGARNDE